MFAGEPCERWPPSAAGIPALAGVALGVLVREDGALRLADGAAREVLRGDEVDAGALLLGMVEDGAPDLGVGVLEVGDLEQAVALARKLGDAAHVALGGRVGAGEEGVDDRGDLRGGRLAGGEDEDVGAVVVADRGGLLGRLGEGGADVGEAVRGDGHPGARRADEDAAVGGAGLDGGGDLLGEVRVVAGLGRGAAGVLEGDALARGEEGLEGFLDGEAGVVGAEGDLLLPAEARSARR